MNPESIESANSIEPVDEAKLPKPQASIITIKQFMWDNQRPVFNRKRAAEQVQILSTSLQDHKDELKRRMQESNEPRTTLSFYQYHHIKDPKAFRDQLFLDWSKLEV